MSQKDSIIEPIRKEIDSLREEIRQLRELVDPLKSENKRLKEKLAASKKNSRNSSKPPSSDISKPKKAETSKMLSDLLRYAFSGLARSFLPWVPCHHQIRSRGRMCQTVTRPRRYSLFKFSTFTT
jgi:regulator of replication initiation timing